jgi:integral membrane protein
VSGGTRAAASPDRPAVGGALLRYRVIAYVVGVVLVVLMLVAMPLKYLAGRPHLVEVVSPVHGFLYVVYLLAAVALARRAEWSLWRTLGVMLGGTVPIVSFVVERAVTRDLTARPVPRPAGGVPAAP